MFTTVAFHESIDQAGIFEPIAAVADQHVRIVGDDIQIPTLNQIVAVAVLAENAVAPRARLVSPSLRVLSRIMLSPVNVTTAAAVIPASPQRVIDRRSSPLALVIGEQLNLEIIANPAVAQRQGGIVWLADGPIVELAGKIFTVRATSATAAVVGAWTNVAVTFDEDLPRGRYQLVGMKALSSGMIAARAVFVGGQGWRPGVLGNTNVNDLESPIFRHGGMGVFGEFEDIEPPTMDVHATTADATQEFYLDLIQLRAGPG